MQATHLYLSKSVPGNNKLESGSGHDGMLRRSNDSPQCGQRTDRPLQRRAHLAAAPVTTYTGHVLRPKQRHFANAVRRQTGCTGARSAMGFEERARPESLTHRISLGEFATHQTHSLASNFFEHSRISFQRHTLAESVRLLCPPQWSRLEKVPECRSGSCC